MSNDSTHEDHYQNRKAGSPEQNTNDHEDDESLIRFNPSDVDVVSTKIRTWNTKHPGNMFYNDLVTQTVSNCQDMTPTDIREAAKRIYEILTVDRGGRFLKLPERLVTSEYCTLLKPRRCVEKTIHAIKTALHKKELRAKGVTQPYKKERTGPCESSQTSASSTKNKSLTTKSMAPKFKPKANLPTIPAPSSSNKSPESLGKSPSKGNDGLIRQTDVSSVSPTSLPNLANSATRLAMLPFSIGYEAVEGNQPIHKYGLKVISVVCSQSDPWTAFQALDVPCSGYTTESEPERERLMRLQLRQRFASAAAAGMSSVEFARKLLEMWGGRLVEAPPVKYDGPATYIVEENDMDKGGGNQKEAMESEQIQEQILDPPQTTVWNKHSPNFVAAGDSGLSLEE